MYIGIDATLQQETNLEEIFRTTALYTCVTSRAQERRKTGPHVIPLNPAENEQACATHDTVEYTLLHAGMLWACAADWYPCGQTYNLAARPTMEPSLIKEAADTHQESHRGIRR